MIAETDFPPLADLRPVDEAAAWVAVNKELERPPREKSPEETALDVRRSLELSALVWLSERYGSSEYNLGSMISEIGEWRDWPLDEEETDSIWGFAYQSIKLDDHRPDKVATETYLYMTRDC